MSKKQKDNYYPEQIKRLQESLAVWKQLIKKKMRGESRPLHITVYHNKFEKNHFKCKFLNLLKNVCSQNEDFVIQ